MKKSVSGCLLLSLLFLGACQTVGQSVRMGNVGILAKEDSQAGPPLNNAYLKVVGRGNVIIDSATIRNGRATVSVPLAGQGRQYLLKVEKGGSQLPIKSGEYLMVYSRQMSSTHWLIVGPAAQVSASCRSHAQCPASEYCARGRCTSLRPGACYKQADCKRGYTCNTKTNNCEQVAPKVQCSETDLKSTAAKGTTTGVTAWWNPVAANVKGHTDYCTNVKQGSHTPSGKTGKYVVEYFCDSHPQYPRSPYDAAIYGKDVFAAFKIVDCPHGCEDGECKSKPSQYIKKCSDSDGGKDRLVAGTVTVEEGDPASALGTSISAATDTCRDAQRVREYICDANNDRREVEVFCKAGEVCSNGKCIPQAAQTCMDWDNGVSPFTASKVVLTVSHGGKFSNVDYPDRCRSPRVLEEQFCVTSTQRSQIPQHCMQGCSNGRCN